MRKSIAMLAVLAGASAVMADTVKLDFVGVDGNAMGVAGTGTVLAGRVKFDVLAGGTSTQFSAGQRVHTFCIDITNVLKDPDTYEITDFAAHVGDSTKSDAVHKLITYAVANNLDFSQANTAATFQAMVWEVLTDYDGTFASLNTTAGGFDISSGYSGDALLINNLINAAHSGTINNNIILTALDSQTGGQDQMYFVVVPLPSSAGLAAVGLMGMAVVRRRRMR